jgi:hypothetical protein
MCNDVDRCYTGQIPDELRQKDSHSLLRINTPSPT